VCVTEDRILVWVKRIFIHDGYEPDSEAGVNNIALLQLEHAVDFSDDVIPLCLPENGSAIEKNSTASLPDGATVSLFVFQVV